MKKTLLFIACVILSVHCTKFDEQFENTTSETALMTRSTEEEVDINPYSLATAQAALNEITDEVGMDRIKLRATDLYVRFLPKDSVEMALLSDSMDIPLFPYPLDRELTDEEVETYSTDITNTYGFPWQYTKVPLDYEFPEGIIYEFLDSVYVQVSSDNYMGPHSAESNQLSEGLWEMVFDRAYGKDTEPATRATTDFEKRWAPEATVRYVDDLTGKTIPLAGVRVRVHHLLHIDIKYTDANGSTGPFERFKSNNVRYNIFWESPYWDIRDGNFLQAKTRGPKYRAAWDVVIQGDTEDAMYAAIHRGCQAFFNDNPYGITEPAKAFHKVKLGAHFSKKGPANGIYTSFWNGPWPDIRIYRNTKYGRRKRWEMTSTTMHELTHASHHRAVINKSGSNQIEDYMTAEEKLVESWATGVQFAMMKWMYPDVPASEYRRYYDDTYTGVVEGLLSQGMTLKQIENTVVGNRFWWGWRRDVKNTGQIDPVIVDQLFDYPSAHNWAVDFDNLILGTAQAYTDMDIVYNIPYSYSSSEANIIPNGIAVQEWTVSSDIAEIKNSNSQSITLRFNATGTVTLTAKLSMLGGATYETSKTITITQPVTMVGNSTPGTGEPVTYQLDGYEGTINAWEFTGLNNRDYWIVATTDNSITVIFRKPCSTTLKAKYQSNVMASKQLTIPDGPTLDPYMAFKTNVHPPDIWLRNTADLSNVTSVTQNGLRYREPLDAPTHFMAYSTMPDPSHPLYSKLVQYHEINFYGRYAYDTWIYDGFSTTGNTFWIFSEQLPGTVPIYLVEDSRVDDRNLVWKTSRLTQENVLSRVTVTSWYWNWLGTKKKDNRDWDETKNWGIKGYAYPVPAQRLGLY